MSSKTNDGGVVKLRGIVFSDAFEPLGRITLWQDSSIVRSAKRATLVIGEEVKTHSEVREMLKEILNMRPGYAEDQAHKEQAVEAIAAKYGITL